MANSRKNGRKQSAPKTQHKCGKCNEILEDIPEKDENQSICCDCCSNFYHIKCENISNAKLQALSQHDLKWYCSYCDRAAASLAEKIIVLEDQLLNVTSELSTVKEELSTTKEELKNEKVQRIIATDKLEAYTRKDSLRINGIPFEEGETSAQLEDKILNIAQKIGVTINRGDISVTHRLKADKKGGVPAIVKFSTRRCKDAVFSAKKNMKGMPDMNDVFISEDLTRLRFRTLLSAKKCKDFKSISTKNGKLFVWRINHDHPVKIESPLDLRKVGVEPDYQFLGLNE